jgi:hypothetical protein
VQAEGRRCGDDDSQEDDRQRGLALENAQVKVVKMSSKVAHLGQISDDPLRIANLNAFLQPREPILDIPLDDSDEFVMTNWNCPDPCH